jgi:hypothetical protein
MPSPNLSSQYTMACSLLNVYYIINNIQNNEINVDMNAVFNTIPIVDEIENIVKNFFRYNS